MAFWKRETDAADGVSAEEPVVIDDRQAVEDVIGEMCRCMVEPDIEGLEQVYEEDGIIVHMLGKAQGRRLYQQGMRRGAYVYDTIDVKDYDIQVEGDTATCSLDCLLVASIYGSLAQEYRVHADIDLVRTPRGWRIIKNLARHVPEN